MNIKKFLNTYKQACRFMIMIKNMDGRIVALTCLNSLLNAVLPYLTYILLGILIDFLIEKKWYAGFAVAVAMLLIRLVLKIFISLLRNRIEIKRQLLYTTFKCDMHLHYLNLDYDTAEKYETVRKIVNANSMVDMYGGLEELINEFGGIVEAFISIGTATIIVIEFVYRLAVSGSADCTEITLTVIGIVVVLLKFFYDIVKNTKEFTLKSQDNIEKHGYNEHALSYFLDHIYSDVHMIQDVKLYNMEALVQNKFDNFLRTSSKNYEEARNINIKFQFKSQLYGCMYSILAFLLLIRQIAIKTISAGMFTRYYNSLLNLSQKLTQLVAETGNMEQTCAYLKSYDEFMKIEAAHVQDDCSETDAVEEICFHNVSYKYQGASTYALKDINCSFKRGENIAIVGKNGAGKSTIIKLLCGLYKPTSGYITVDGVDIAKLDTKAWRLFGTVFQECVLFPFSIGENIACASYYNDDRIWKCLENVGLKEKIGNLPQKLGMAVKNISDDGLEFSGGEEQKMVVARAMYRNSHCMVLDEPAAALDVTSENELYEAFSNLTENKIGVLVSHRMSSCTFCDKIMVINEGTIDDVGTHSYLLNNNALYRSLWEAQAKYYNNEIGHIS